MVAPTAIRTGRSLSIPASLSPDRRSGGCHFHHPPARAGLLQDRRAGFEGREMGDSKARRGTGGSL